MPKFNPTRPYLLAFLVIAVLLCGVRAFSDIAAPIDCDEAGVIGRFTHDGLFEPHPDEKEFPSGRYFNFSATYHMLSRTLAFASMGLFGASKEAARLPGTLFSIGFLIICALFCYRYLPVPVGVLLFVHFLVNENLNWFFHSSRGYPVLFFMTMLGIFLVWSSLVKKEVSRLSKQLFVGLLLIALWNHHMGVFVMTMLVAAGVLWGFLNRATLEAKEKAVIVWYARTYAYFVPAMIVLFVGSLISLIRCNMVRPPSGDLVQVLTKPMFVFQSVGASLGIFRLRWELLLAGMMTVLVVFNRRRFCEKTVLSFLGCFLVASLLILGGLSFTFVELPPRYVLWITAPLVLLMGATCFSTEPKWVRWASGGMLAFFLIAVPMSESHPRVVTNLGTCEPSTYEPLFLRWVPSF